MIFVYFFGQFIVVLLLLFVWSMIIFNFFGPPVVPTPKWILEEIFLVVKPKKGELFVDLGSGSGRVVKMAVQKYGAKGLGVEINPFLVFWSKISAKFLGIKNIEFRRENYLKTDFSGAKIIFMYMLPQFLPPVVAKIEKECKKGTIIISQRFAVGDWQDKLIKEITRPINSTFVYRL